MTAGDSLHYSGEKPHSWSNKTEQPARLLWIGRMQYEKSGEIQRQVSLNSTPAEEADRLGSG